MRIRTYLAVSVDGFVATPDGKPTILAAPDFDPGRSYGFPQFLEQIDAVVMGRSTFEPALTAPRWPWPGKRVYVLTSRPLPTATPDDVVVADGGTVGLLEKIRSAGHQRDAHLVGGPKTIEAFRQIGALDRLELLILPLQLGRGLPLAATDSEPQDLRLEEQETFPDGTIHLVYTPR